MSPRASQCSVKRKPRNPMPDITIERTKQVPTSRLLPDRLPAAVDWIILPAVEIANGQHDLIWLAGKRPVASLVSSTKLIAERAGTTTQELPEIPERFSAHSHWGINE